MGGNDFQRYSSSGSMASPQKLMDRLYGPFVHFVFCISGVMCVMLAQWEDYHGLGGNSNVPVSRTTGLPALPCFLGSAMAVGFLFKSHIGIDGVPHRMFDSRMILITFCGLLGEVSNQASIVLAGSLTFTVVYSSLTIWAALLGIPMLRKAPNKWQWAAMVVIVLGLLASAASHTAVHLKHAPHMNHTNASFHHEAMLRQTASQSADRTYLLGAAAGLVGSMSYALMYVLIEVVSKEHDSPPAEVLCAFFGVVNTCITVVYIVAWDGPRWKDLVSDQVSGTYGELAWVYFLLVITSFVHFLTFFQVSQMSAVMAGINKAAQAVCCFAAGHVFYCSSDPEQCLNRNKALAMTVVVGGVLGFSFAKTLSHAHHPGTTTEEDGFDELEGYEPSIYRHSWHGLELSGTATYDPLDSSASEEHPQLQHGQRDTAEQEPDHEEGSTLEMTCLSSGGVSDNGVSDDEGY